MDPLAASFAYFTPYQYAGNSPIENIDLDGLEGASAIAIKVKELYNPKLDVDLSNVGSSATSLNRNRTVASTYTKKGGIRNSIAYWNRVLESNPEMFNAANKARIRNGAQPVVNPQWVKHNSSHGKYMGDVLIHHHKYQGKVGTAMPQTAHQKFSAVLHPFNVGNKYRASLLAKFKTNLGKAAGVAGVLAFLGEIPFVSENPGSFFNLTFGNGASVGQLYFDQSADGSPSSNILYIIDERVENYDDNGNYLSTDETRTYFELSIDDAGDPVLNELETKVWSQGKGEKSAREID